MRIRRIALLNAASPEHQYSTNRNFQACLPDSTLRDYHAIDGDLPTHHDFDAFIITGSKASVLDNTDWVTELKEYVSTAIDKNKPILGICFGHQLLIDVLGGTVEPMGKYELGYLPITQTADSPLLTNVDDPFYSFITHEDIATELPEGATQIAKTDHGIHGFEYENLYGLQSHPEFTVATAQLVVEQKETSPEIESRAFESITAENAAAAQKTRQIFHNFFSNNRSDKNHHKRMNRRTLLTTTGSLTASSLAGCLSNNTEEQPNTDTPTQQIKTFNFTRIESTSKNLIAGEATVTTDGTTVTVEGIIQGNNGCKTAQLTSATYDSDADELRVNVAISTKEDANQRTCTQALVNISYRTTVTFTEQTPARVVVTHNEGNGAEIVTSEKP